jgi:hypothetical protein
MRDMIFRFRTVGRDHEAGNKSCPGCEEASRQAYPRPHRDYGSTCLGLVHRETLAETDREPSRATYMCDVCNTNPETLSDLCRRADSEKDFDKLLELAEEIQRRLEVRRRG